MTHTLTIEYQDDLLFRLGLNSEQFSAETSKQQKWASS